MDIVETHTLSQKRDTVFEKLKGAAKLNVAFGCLLNNVENGSYRYYYAHEKNTLLERSNLVATKDDLIKMQKCVV